MPTRLLRFPQTHTHTGTHEIQGMDKIMETLDNTGMQGFELVALKEH